MTALAERPAAAQESGCRRMHEFFERRSLLLAKTKDELRRGAEVGIAPPGPEIILFSKNSPFGAFIRRTKLEFNRLRFHDAADLWKDFVAYRQITAAYYRRKMRVLLAKKTTVVVVEEEARRRPGPRCGTCPW